MNVVCNTKQKVMTEAVLIKKDGTRINLGVISHNYSIINLIFLKIKFLFNKNNKLLYESVKQISIMKEIKNKFKGGK